MLITTLCVTPNALMILPPCLMPFHISAKGKKICINERGLAMKVTGNRLREMVHRAETPEATGNAGLGFHVFTLEFCL